MKEFKGSDVADDENNIGQDDETRIIPYLDMIQFTFSHCSPVGADNLGAYAGMSFCVFRVGYRKRAALHGTVCNTQ